MKKENLNILVVDDMTYISSLLLDHLRIIGVSSDVRKAVNVEQAINVIKEAHQGPNKINFVITDINMPEKSGIDLVNILRITPAYKNIPIIVITSDENNELVLQAIKAGANSYLFKPWSSTDLDNAIMDCFKDS